MSSRIHRTGLAAVLIGAAAALAGFAPAPAVPVAPVQARPDDGSEYKKIIDSASEALVTIKFVMKSPDGEGSGDEEEVNGVIIDPKGLVVCSYWFLGGAANMFGGGAAKPQDIKVLIGDDTEGKKATLISHDTELDLAWIKLDEEPAAPLKHVDIEKSAAPASVGQRVFLLSRFEKFFGRSPVVNEGRLRGETTTPRRLFIPTVSTLLADRADIGLPLFNADANVVGFMVVQVPDKETMEATENPGGGPMVLPVEEVAKATKRAIEAHKEAGNGEKKDEVAPPSPPPAPEPPKEPAPTPDK